MKPWYVLDRNFINRVPLGVLAASADTVLIIQFQICFLQFSVTLRKTSQIKQYYTRRSIPSNSIPGAQYKKLLYFGTTFRNLKYIKKKGIEKNHDFSLSKGDMFLKCCNGCSVCYMETLQICKVFQYFKHKELIVWVELATQLVSALDWSCTVNVPIYRQNLTWDLADEYHIWSALQIDLYLTVDNCVYYSKLGQFHIWICTSFTLSQYLRTHSMDGHWSTGLLCKGQKLGRHCAYGCPSK